MVYHLPYHMPHQDMQHPMAHVPVEYFLLASRSTQPRCSNQEPGMTCPAMLHGYNYSQVSQHKRSKGKYFLSRDRYHPDQKSCIPLSSYTIFLHLQQISCSLFSIMPALMYSCLLYTSD